MQKLKFGISLIALLIFFSFCLPDLWSDDLQEININTASADELINLKGIGEKKAMTIIEFREKNGPFEHPEDLIKVPGIGPKTLEANKNRIVVE